MICYDNSQWVTRWNALLRSIIIPLTCVSLFVPYFRFSINFNKAWFPSYRILNAARKAYCIATVHFPFRWYQWKQVNSRSLYFDCKQTAVWEKYPVILTKITVTSLRMMENIHPNHNHPCESLHVIIKTTNIYMYIYVYVYIYICFRFYTVSDHCVHNKRHELKPHIYICTDHIPLKRNEQMCFGTRWRKKYMACKWYGLILIEISANVTSFQIMGSIHSNHRGLDVSIRIRISCVRKIIVKFHTLLATVHVVRPRSDKRPVNFMVNTVSEIETTLSCADYRTWTTWPTICLQLGFSGRTPPVDILAIPTDQLDLISYHVTFCRMNLYVDDCTEFHCLDCTGTRFQCMYRYQSLCLWKEQSELNIHLRE